MKVILYFLLLVGIYSCNTTHQKEEIIIENNIHKSKTHFIDIQELLFVDKMGIYDSLLILINRKSDTLFYAYNISDFSYKGSFGAMGNAPSDFHFPFFLNIPSKEENTIHIFDVNSATFKKINLRKIINKEIDAVSTDKMPHKLIGSPNLHLRDDSCFVGNIDNGEGLYFIYHTAKDEIEWINFPTTVKTPENNFTVMNMNRISLNFKTGNVVSGMGYYNQLSLHDNQGNLVRTVQLGSKAITPTVVGEHYISEENFIFCRDIASTDETIFALIQNIKEKDFENIDNTPSRIVVLDWNLNYLKTYQLPHYSLSFCIDKLNNRIIYTALNKEGGTDIHYITL